MAKITVTAEDLAQQSTMLAGMSSQVDALFRQMGKQLSPLAEDWQGAASSQFQQLWGDWQQGAAQVKQALDGISKLLHQAGTTYQNAEDAIRSSMAQ